MGQGNAATGPGFLALSDQIVNAYQCKGHGSRMVSSLTLRIFTLVALIYVDDVDLQHTTTLITEIPSELIKHSKHSTNAWGGLAIATGWSISSSMGTPLWEVQEHSPSLHC